MGGADVFSSKGVPAHDLGALVFAALARFFRICGEPGARQGVDRHRSGGTHPPGRGTLGW